MDFQTLTAAKVAMLTELVAELYADKFSTSAAPLRSLANWHEAVLQDLEARAKSIGAPQEHGMVMEGEFAAFVNRVGERLKG